jgi:mRNA interferase RelE/StbE
VSEAKIVLLPEARDDLHDLDGAEQKIVLKGLLKLRSEPAQRGAPLGSRAPGNLTGLRKLVVGNRDYRIVYDVQEDGTIVVVWVIARRADDEVYRLAVARLKTYTGDHQKRVILRQILDTAWGR